METIKTTKTTKKNATTVVVWFLIGIVSMFFKFDDTLAGSIPALCCAIATCAMVVYFVRHEGRMSGRDQIIFLVYMLLVCGKVIGMIADQYSK